MRNLFWLVHKIAVPVNFTLACAVVIGSLWVVSASVYFWYFSDEWVTFEECINIIQTFVHLLYSDCLLTLSVAKDYDSFWGYAMQLLEYVLLRFGDFAFTYSLELRERSPVSLVFFLRWIDPMFGHAVFPGTITAFVYLLAGKWVERRAALIVFLFDDENSRQ